MGPTRRTRIVATLALAAATLGVTATVAPEAGATAPAVTRYAGANRYHTAALAALGKTIAVVAVSEGDAASPDALSAAGLAGAKGGDILLTRKDSLPTETRSELLANDVNTVYLMGGTAAVSQTVEDQIVALGITVTRVAGANREGTAAAAQSRIGAAAKVILVGRDAPADALTAGALAYGKHYPILMTGTDTLSPEADAAIAASGADEVLIVGGTVRVSQSVEDGLEATALTVTRLSGATRVGTAIAVAEHAVALEGASFADIGIANGFNSGADAFPAAAVLGSRHGVTIITDATVLAAEAEAFLTEHRWTIDRLFLFGGALALSQAVEDAATDAADPGSNQSFPITPSDRAQLTTSTSSTNNTGRRTYTATGLDNTKTYDLALFPQAQVKVATDGTVTFTANAAAATSAGWSIEDVNGTAKTAAATGAGIATVNNITPVGGQITFILDSVAAVRLVPVLNADTDADNSLDLEAGASVSTPKAPTEPFAIGGETEWRPVEASSGALSADNDVNQVNVSGGYLIADDNSAAATVGTLRTMYFDSGDTYKIAANQVEGVDTGATCSTVTQAVFLANLSAGDELDVSTGYKNQTGPASTWCLEDLAPGSPGSVAATGSDNSITTTWTAPTSGADSYNVYRATDPSTGNSCAAGADLPTTAFTKVGSATVLTFTESGVANGTYCIQVTAVLGTEESALVANTGAQAVTLARPPAIVANGAVVNVDVAVDDLLDAGDELTLILDENVVLSTPSIMISDADGDTATLSAANVNATITSSGAIVTIAVTATPPDNFGPNEGIDLPVTLIGIAGVRDAANNSASHVGAGDTSFEDSGPEMYSDSAVGGETTFTVTFNELVNEASAENVVNYTYNNGTGAAAILSATLGPDGRTLTIVVPGGKPVVVGGPTVLNNTVSDTDGQASTQIGYIVA